MTNQDKEKLFTVTYSKLEADFGLMGDLPHEVANVVANVYLRYFEQGLASATAIPHDEFNTRVNEYQNMVKVVAEFRKFSKSQTADHIEILADFIVDVYKFRMPGALTKMPIRRMIERKFRKSRDIPNLINVLQLYQ
jgi:hypothetical protein